MSRLRSQHIGLLLLLLLIGSCAMSQKGPSSNNGYRIDMQIVGAEDSTLYLGFYYKSKTYVKDTAQADSKGVLFFEGEKSLPQGFYFVMLNKKILFQLAVGEDQHFIMKTDRKDYVGTMEVFESEENRILFEGYKKNAETYQLMRPYLRYLNDSTASDANRGLAEDKRRFAKKKMKRYRDSVIAAHPELVVSRFMKANQGVSVPTKTPSGEKASDLFKYEYYKQHFFDHIDLSDPLLLRLPENIFKEKVEKYLDKLVVPQADSIIASIEYMVDMTKKESEPYTYLVWILTRKYQEPEFMGLDSVMVHIYDKYYATGDMDDWANEKLKKSLGTYVGKIRKSLVGKVAPDITLQDLNERPKSLYGLRNKYRVMYFYDPDCGACKKETPKLLKFHQETRFDVGVYAVSVDTSMQKMRDYVAEMKLQKWTHVFGARTYGQSVYDLYDAYSTPTLLLIDNDNRIIAKKIPAERLEAFLQNEEERKKRQKNKGG